ncbi:MAG: metallophosphoesterase family protein [Oscillospiraceae bacterium]|nr:metallophosphoesterase family protein [Oscillospiraceae bacterium]
MGTKLIFNNGRFKIMQIADVQEFKSVSPDTVKLLELAIREEKPDLIIFSGDQIYGIHPLIWGKSPDKNVRDVISQLLAPVQKAGVPFAVTFGNHDAESGVTKERQAEFYAEIPGYMPGEKRSKTDPGTFFLPVYTENGQEKFAVYAFDTHGSSASGGKSGVTNDQLKWFAEMRERENKALGALPPAIVFQHIPVPEYYNVLKRVKKGTRGSVEAYGEHKNKFYVLPEEIKQQGGFMKESPAVTEENTGEFDVLRADGGVKALSVGHDHNNSFVCDYLGIKLIYTQGAGFHVYGPHLKRGVRLFTIDETDPSAFITYTRTWESLTSSLPKKPLLEFFLTHTPTGMDQALTIVKRASPFALAGCAAAGCAAYLAIKQVKNKKISKIF